YAGSIGIGGVRNEVLLRVRRNDDHGYAKTGENKIAIRSNRAGAGVARQQVGGPYAIRADRGLRGDMVVETARLVKGKNKYGCRPGAAVHDRVNDLGHEVRARLNAATRRTYIAVGGMFIQSGERGRLDLDHFRQGSVLQIGKKLWQGCDVLRLVVDDVMHV